MRTEATFTGLSLEGNPGDLSQGPVKIKTFCEAGEKDDYAEFFTNIELDKHRVEFREKDEEYRPGVVKALRVP
jgi:hypothetical protein